MGSLKKGEPSPSPIVCRLHSRPFWPMRQHPGGAPALTGAEDITPQQKKENMGKQHFIAQHEIGVSWDKSDFEDWQE